MKPDSKYRALYRTALRHINRVKKDSDYYESCTCKLCKLVRTFERDVQAIHRNRVR